MTRSTIAFARHYAEMVLVMFTGMGIFAGTLAAVAAGLGSSYGEVRDEAPALILFGMGFGMTAAMVWWMSRRGHSWPANRAMALAMILPTVATLALLGSGVTTDLDALITIEHAVMFPAMLAAMVPYRDEFTHRPASATA